MRILIVNHLFSLFAFKYTIKTVNFKKQIQMSVTKDPSHVELTQTASTLWEVLFASAVPVTLETLTMTAVKVCFVQF